MRQQSIARRLLVWMLVLQALSAVAIVVVTLAYERHTQFRALDVMLHGRADTLLGAVQEAENQPGNVMLDRASLDLPEEDVYEVRDSTGRVLGHSTRLLPESSSWPEKAGFFRLKLGGKPYRALRIRGVRVVDPDEGGGTRHVVTVTYGAPTASVWEHIERAVAFYAGASLLLLLITGSLVAWLLKRGLLPLHELAVEAEGVSIDRPRFHPPASARATRELAPLALALEAAVHRLEQSFDQQRQFVSDAAHELKTAVAVIKSSVQVLHMRPRSTEEYRAGIGRLLEDCERMEVMIADMLLLARFESGPAATSPVPSTDATVVVRQIAAQFHTMAELLGVTLEVITGVSVSLAVTVEDFTLLCSNLVMNALQHSPSGGCVALTLCAVDAGTVEFRVRDQGDGIARDLLPHVFDRFFRGDPSRTRRTGGTGLGLAICRAVAVRAGGSISLESTPGSGTTARVLLPGQVLLEVSAETPASTGLLSSA